MYSHNFAFMTLFFCFFIGKPAFGDDYISRVSNVSDFPSF